MPDINTVIQKINDYIEKGKAGKQNDPWDIQWNSDYNMWQHRHPNYNQEKASRGGWHKLEQKHKKSHAEWIKFEQDILFDNKLPSDPTLRMRAEAIREKYGAVKPTEEEFLKRAKMEGFDDSETWTEDKIPKDIKPEVSAGTKTRKVPVRQHIGERPPPVEVLEKPTEPIREEIAVDYRNKLEEAGVAIKDTRTGIYAYRTGKKGEIISDIFRVSEIDGKYRITAFVDETLDTDKLSPIQDKLDMSFDSINDVFDAINSVIFKPPPAYIKEPEDIIPVVNTSSDMVSLKEKLGLQYNLTPKTLLTVSDPKYANAEIVKQIITTENKENMSQIDSDVPETDDAKTIRELQSIESDDIWYSQKQINKIKELAKKLSDDVIGLNNLKTSLAEYNNAVIKESGIEDRKEKQKAIMEIKDSLNKVKESVRWLVAKSSIKQDAGERPQPKEEKPEPKEEGKKPADIQEQLISRWKNNFTNKKVEFKTGGTKEQPKWGVIGANPKKPNIKYIITTNPDDETEEHGKYTFWEYDADNPDNEKEITSFSDLNTAFDGMWKYIYHEKAPIQKSDTKADELFAFLDSYKKMAGERIPDKEVEQIFKTLFSQILNNKQYLSSFAAKHNLENKLNDDINKFHEAKDRVDKVIAVDSFMHLCHQNKGLMPIAFGFIDGDDIISNRVNNILTQLSLDNDTWRMIKQVDGGGVAVASDTFTPTFSGGKQKRINFFK